MTYQFSIYSRAEAMLLLDLACEHRSEVITRCRETNFFTEISVHPSYQELQAYFDHMLRQLREQQRHLESLYRRSPDDAPPPSPSPDLFSTWQDHVIL